MQTFKQKLIDEVNKSLDVDFTVSDLNDTPDISLGQYSLPCFKLAKEKKQAPQEIANQFSDKLNSKSDLWRAVSADGAYLNFQIKDELWNEYVLESKEEISTQNEKVMIEYSQPNTHKEFHVGHLRTACLGASLVNVNRYLGNKTIAANYIGDTGVHVAKCLWCLLKKYSQDIPYKDLTGEKLGEIYAEAVGLINEDPGLEKEVSKIHSQIENGDLKKIWKKTKEISMENFYQIYDLLNIKFDEWFWESEEEVAGKKLLKKLLKTGEIKQIKEDNGAVIADLKEFNLEVLVLIKTDGNLLYGTKDLPLGKKKFDKYKVDKSIYVVDNRQSLYLKQIFKLLDLMGYEDKEKIHVAYDFVTLPDGAMASRKGNVVTFRHLYNEILGKVKEETKKRHDDWDNKKIDHVAEKVSLAAIKFFILKYENNSVITFDIDKAVAVEGATGPYLLYSLARLNSIITKVGKIDNNVDYSLLKEVAEKDLIKHLSNFNQIIELTASKNQPSYLCTYLLELAQKFNTFYHEHSIIKADEELKNSRIKLLMSIKDIFEKGMDLLNIEVVEEM